MNRRDFLKTGIGAAAGVTAMPAIAAGKRPNFLLIITDQQGMDAISGHGCGDVRTPNIDRLVNGGVSFRKCYSAWPLCSPGRSSLFTGRMPSETGVVNNNVPILPTIPNIGQWLGRDGYETVYSGKWHLPETYPVTMPGFTVLPGGIGGQGNTGDAGVSRSCQGYLLNRTPGSKPFFMVTSLLQPHDICEWVTAHFGPDGWESQPANAGKMPDLPPNFNFDRNEPQMLVNRPRPRWSGEEWRFYLWSYYHHVEMVDAEIGRVLNALEDSGERDNTIVIMTSDHGEGRGRHHMVLKNYLYDEAANVPLMFSCPGHMPAGKQDSTHLVSGVDLMPTISDFAGMAPPPDMVGRSLRPVIEGKSTEWREFVAAEVVGGGHMIRTPGHKYVMYNGDPVEQFFDMQADAGETHNLAPDSAHAGGIEDHRKLLKEWTGRLKLAPPRGSKRRGNQA
jgi:choline-sulfatase